MKNKSNRPVIQIEFERQDVALEILCVAGLIALWVYVFISYSALPETIPQNYDLNGSVKSYGSKDNIFITAGVGTLVYVLLTVINRFPHNFNYLSEITPENAKRQYTLATKMIRWLKAGIILIFFVTVHITIDAAGGKNSSLPGYFLPLVMGVTFIPVIIYILLSLKK
ncbi:MAG: DUF1648 domain-containing protein [Ignavibacteriaceae bacterium]|nr:DUF1648 domain-containing protein [Ignavibacteriaceae bacterium]